MSINSMSRTNMKMYARILILMILIATHLTWVIDTGTNYMDDVITLGRLFYPVLLPYAILAATLSFLLGSRRTEKGCALVLFGVIAIAVSQTVGIKVDGDRWHLLSNVCRQFHPEHSLAPWLLIGLCFQQLLVAAWKKRYYFTRWSIPLTGFSLAYAVLGYIYIVSRIDPAFPLRSSLSDAVLVFSLGSVIFGLFWALILPFYDVPVTVLPYWKTQRDQSDKRD